MGKYIPSPSRSYTDGYGSLMFCINIRNCIVGY